MSAIQAEFATSAQTGIRTNFMEDVVSSCESVPDNPRTNIRQNNQLHCSVGNLVRVLPSAIADFLDRFAGRGLIWRRGRECAESCWQGVPWRFVEFLRWRPQSRACPARRPTARAAGSRQFPRPRAGYWGTVASKMHALPWPAAHSSVCGIRCYETCAAREAEDSSPG